MVTIKKKAFSTKKQSEPQIMNVAHKAVEFWSANRKRLVIVASSLAAALVIIGGYSLYESALDKKAAPLVSAAYQYYVPSAGVPDYKKALDMFTDIRNRYPNTMSGAVAQFYIGNIHADLGRTDEALKEYRYFVKKYSGDRFLLGLVYQRMGYLYSALGNQVEAEKSFENAEAAAGPGIATYELAKMYEREGKIPESQKKYREVAEKLTGSIWAMEAVSKLPQPPALPAPAAQKPGQGKAGK